MKILLQIFIVFSQLYGHAEGKPFTLESSLAYLDVTFGFQIIFTKISHCYYFS